jgi:hypothetical protein
MILTANSDLHLQIEITLKKIKLEKIQAILVYKQIQDPLPVPVK